MAYICLLIVCAGSTGCSLFGKKSPAKPEAPAQQQSPAPNWPATSQNSTPMTAVPAAVNGLIAGRVIDSFDRKPPPTFVRVVSATDQAGSREPVEVACDGDGYFTIHNLQPGQHYELIARTREGEAKLAGRTWATPPNPRVLIYISGDFASPNTPAAPGAPRVPGPKPRSGGNSPGNSDDQGNNGGSQRPAGIGAPSRIEDGAASPPNAVQPQAIQHPESIADAPEMHASAPTVNIPSQGGSYPRLQNSGALDGSVSSKVPFCVLTGQQLDNFGLYDLNGRPWEYRNHTGRLVLLDFWGTWCVPCRYAIYHLKILDDRYRSSGLEVIGLAYERGGSPPEQARRVQGVRDQLGINYRLLLGADMASCPVKAQFGVTAFPTLVLLDERNRIIWRAEGPDQYKLQDLELVIRQQLHVR
jgi:thiol-disulfide isomerase/thioredoxin